MKNLLIACSKVSACVLVACADVLAQSTPKTEEMAWFDVSTTATNNGTLAANGNAQCTPADSKFEIDSDLENLVVFTAADALTQQMAKVTFNLDAAIVPNGALPTFENKAPKIAFALYQSGDTTANFMARLGSDWITLTGATVPAEGTPYTLTIELDNRVANASKVRFSVAISETTTVLLPENSTDGWIDYATPVTGAGVKVNFLGCGKVASFIGKQLNVIGEIIVIEGKGSVDVKKEDVKAFENAIPVGSSYDTVDKFLAAPANDVFANSSFQTGLTVAEAYAIGLVAKDASGTMAPVDDGALKVKADAQAGTTDGIKVALNITPPDVNDTGATISYQLQGSTDGSSYTNIGKEESEQSAIKIPTDCVDGSNEKPKYRFFKVVTKVTLKGGETPAQSLGNP